MLFGIHRNLAKFTATGGFDDAKEQQPVGMLGYRDVHAEATEGR